MVSRTPVALRRRLIPAASLLCCCGCGVAWKWKRSASACSATRTRISSKEAIVSDTISSSATSSDITQNGHCSTPSTESPLLLYADAPKYLKWADQESDTETECETWSRRSRARSVQRTRMHSQEPLYPRKGDPKEAEGRRLRSKFNSHPKKGMRELINAGRVQDNPEAVAEYLFRTEGLSKKAVGEYLGGGDETHRATLKAFANLHDFTNLNLLEALRSFLNGFFMPGEAQVIDRILNAFSDRYYMFLPPGGAGMTDSGAVYFVCMAVIMLNVHLHNPAAKRSAGAMPLEKWVDMVRQGDGCQNLDEQFLRTMYNSIKQQQFAIPTDEGSNLLSSLSKAREGWLFKQGSSSVLSGRVKNWKKRYFVLSDQKLLYFENSTDKDPKGMIPLENVAVREIQDRARPFCFEIYSTNSDNIKAWKQDADKVPQKGNHAVYKMCAASKEEMDDWIKKMREHISETAFEEMLNAHRERRANQKK